MGETLRYLEVFLKSFKVVIKVLFIVKSLSLKSLKTIVTFS